MIFDEPDDSVQNMTPEQIRQELQKFEEALGDMYFPELALVRKRHEWRWLIEQHESKHTIQ